VASSGAGNGGLLIVLSIKSSQSTVISEHLIKKAHLSYPALSESFATLLIVSGAFIGSLLAWFAMTE